MSISVLYFAALRERCGQTQETLELPSPPTVQGLKAVLEARHPFLAGRWSQLRIAVDLEFSDDAALLRDGCEVALIPPVAGGVDVHPRAQLLETPLSVDAALAQVAGAGMGGICIFVGMVRDHANGHQVHRLDYSAYAPMALKEMSSILNAAEAQHSARISCHHRLGNLLVGDLAVVIAAAAPHRAESFAACRQVIEALKASVPIWKHEHGPDGMTWVGMGP